MKPTIDLFCGSPIEHDSEKQFLDRLAKDLVERGESATIYANFFPPIKPLQIDFLVITSKCACHVELKHFTAPVSGGVNGQWQLRRPNGSWAAHDAQNPYSQALAGKFAISDEMRAYARSNPSIPIPPNGKAFYTRLTSVICIYPTLLRGSQVHEDHKVSVRGYPEFLELLCGQECNPGWSKEQWQAFAMQMRLYRIDSSEDRIPPEVRASGKLIQEYRLRFREFHEQEASPRVCTELRSANGMKAGEADIEESADGSHTQILGPSGCGKSLMAKHLSLALLERGRTPLLIPAKDYDGRLSNLLDRSIAHLHPDTAMSLLTAAGRAGAVLRLVVDGLNECPPRYRRTFIKDLQAFELRWNVPLLITSQDAVELPETLSGAKYTFEPLKPEEKEAILRAKCPINLPEWSVAAVHEFRSAFEIALFAECCAEFNGPASRAELYDAYLRKCCERAENATIVRRIFGAMADLMRRRLTSTLTMAEVWRLANKVVETHGGRSQIVTAALNCGVMETRQGRCSFRHEMLERWFQAEELARTTAPEELGRELARPRNRALAEFVLSAESSETNVRRCLETLGDPGLVVAAVQGRYGETAYRVVETDCLRMLDRAQSALPSTDFELHDEDTWGRVETTGGPSWSTYDLALMAAVGKALARGHFIDEYVRLVRGTEERCRWAVANKSPDGRGLRGRQARGIFISMFIMQSPRVQSAVAASAIYNSFRFEHHFRVGPDDAELRRKTASLSCDPSECLPGELLVVCGLMRTYKPCPDAILLPMLQSAWAKDLYHLKLEALGLATSYSQEIAGSERDAVVEFLSSRESGNLFLNSAIIETLMAYGQVESPVSPEDAQMEIADLLADGETDRARASAYAVVSRIFEDVFQNVYWDAIESLHDEDRAKLMTMAALGAPDYGSATDWILEQLVKLKAPCALPAFEKWVAVPDAVMVSSQDATARFAVAIRGWSQHVATPPAWHEPKSDAERAWQMYGTIYYWMNREGISEDTLRKQCAPAWLVLHTELAFQAVDPLHQFEREFNSRPGETIVARLSKTFPGEIKIVLEFGIKHLSRLTGLFEGPFSVEGLPGFVIRWLGVVGNSHTVKLLEAFVESPELGLDALASIKSIKQTSSML